MIRTGFKQQQLERKPQPLYALTRTYTGVHHASILVIPKDKAGRNSRLLEMARGMPCLMRSPVCDNDTDTVVSAHSNQYKHGKAMGRKANDQYTVFACARCHTWFDQGNTATRAEKIEAFSAGHARQVELWETIAADPREKPADRRAAQWALDELV